MGPILFATYWNEIEWIEASLEQIDKINPSEIIICDGCYDPLKANRSTDGTREIIEQYVSERTNARLISAVRLTRFQHILNWMRSLPHEDINIFHPAKIRFIRRFIRTNVYRLNQAATFNKMIKLSNGFDVGSWFMTYDCDQFYDDSMIEQFGQLSGLSSNMLTSKEKTFFGSFDSFTMDYEKRDYNNMPHKIFADTRFIPTRHPARIKDGQYVNCSDFEDNKQFSGYVYHYHVKSPGRISDGYSLGDRKPPEKLRTSTEKYTGKHPEIVSKHFL